MYQMMICDDYDHHRVILSFSGHCGNDLDQIIIINWDQGVRTVSNGDHHMGAIIVIIIWS